MKMLETKLASYYFLLVVRITVVEFGHFGSTVIKPHIMVSGSANSTVALHCSRGNPFIGIVRPSLSYGYV